MTKNTLRIIGGTYRSRKLLFPDAEGLRPTGDRVRETLFNWLTPYITGANCLDAFAGSGALGLEALSRGAQQVLFVEKSNAVCENLRNSIQLLRIQETRAQVICSPLESVLPTLNQRFDIIFLDPPFAGDLLQLACDQTEALHLLNSNGLIYLEQPRNKDSLVIPIQWELFKSRQSGNVCYQLYRHR